jgi:RNA polymerase sigma-70 factor (ECF subfamily)
MLESFPRECNLDGPSRVISPVSESPEVGEDRFDDFYVFAYPRLVATLVFVTGDQDLARDAVDRACARAVERLNRGQEIDVLEAWVRVVARNVALGRLRRLTSERRARRRLLAGTRGDDVDPTADTAAAIDVRAALGALSRRQREVVVMHYFLGQSIEEIAGELGVPTGTVKSALHRARAALADLLTETSAPSAKEL